jgi:hypothetical protein
VTLVAASAAAAVTLAGAWRYVRRYGGAR